MNIKITFKNESTLKIDDIRGFKDFREFANSIRIDGLIIFNQIAVNSNEIQMFEEVK